MRSWRVQRGMRKAIAIMLDDAQRQEPGQLTRSRTKSVRMAERARLVVLAAGSLQDKQIGQTIVIPRQKSGRWRKRYQAGPGGHRERCTP